MLGNSVESRELRVAQSFLRAEALASLLKTKFTVWFCSQLSARNFQVNCGWDLQVTFPLRRDCGAAAEADFCAAAQALARIEGVRELKCFRQISPKCRLLPRDHDEVR
jgi:hypothetical protein